MSELADLEKRIGINFKNPELLTQALVHRSYLNEHPEMSLDHNERLEFLGDAVLEIVTTEYLYNNYPNPEGDLTNWRAALVNSKTLAECAHRVGLDDHILLSKGEAQDDKSKARQCILADALEAVIGAIYLDRGITSVKKFIKKNILSQLPEILEKELYMDAKTKFQEVAQEKLGITPSYKVLKEWGPAHAKNFEVGIYLDKDLVAQGAGTSKQEAQVSAAENGLKEKGW